MGSKKAESMRRTAKIVDARQATRYMPKTKHRCGSPAFRRADYLRTMLIHGARSVMRSVVQKADTQNWAFQVASRRNKNVAAIALANKMARIDEREYRPGISA